MEPKIITKDACKVVGLQAVGKGPENIDFRGLWERFMPQMQGVGGIDGVCYGVCECAGEAGMKYTAAVEVASLESIPADMVGIDIPAGRYAVFTHKGPLSTLGNTYGYIYGTWLPSANADRADRPEFEFYDERFKVESDESELDIYIPIK